MTEAKIKLIPLPIMDVVASDIKGKGEFRQLLSVQQLKDLVIAGMKLTTDSYSFLNPSVSDPLVEINDSGVIIFDTKVTIPAPQANIHLRVNWQNDTTPGVLKLSGLTLESQYSDAAKVLMSLRGVDVDGSVKSSVAKPNEILGGVIRKQMFVRGVGVSAIGFIVENKNLKVVVKGAAI